MLPGNRAVCEGVKVKGERSGVMARFPTKCLLSHKLWSLQCGQVIVALRKKIWLFEIFPSAA